MTPSDFREHWAELGDNVLTFLPSSLEGVSIPEDARAFLLLGGLPEEAAPFLTFESPKKGPLPTVAGVYRLGPAYRRYRVLGSDGSGDPICVDEEQDGAVVSLAHDDGFRPVVMNSSISHLAESLLTFRQLVEETNARFGEDAYLDGNIPPDLRRWAEEELRRIDPQAFQPNGFWLAELSALDGMKQG